MQDTMIRHLAAAFAGNILDLHILPTEQCNFRCVYCYETFNLGKMSPTIVNAIRQLLMRRIPELKRLRISWFGGEPLAATDIVLDISRYARELADCSGCHYHFGMTTNGYLLDKQRLLVLFNAGVSSYQISLDGPRELHNQTRKRADGEGSFDKIWQHLVAAQQLPLDFEIILRIHITPENFTFIPDLLKQIKSQFRHDSRFKVFLKAIENLGGPHAGTFDVLKGKTKIEILSNLQESLGSEINVHAIKKDGLPYICYAAAQNAWVIRADGTLAKCTVALQDERNRVGKINEDGTFALDHQKMQLWVRGLKTMDTAAMGCPAYKLPKLNNIPIKVL